MMQKITPMLTPHGLKIRLDNDFCNQLPLKNNKTIDDILNNIEVFTCTASWVTFICGIFSFFVKLPNIYLFMIAFVITLIVLISSWIYPLFSFVHSTLTLSEPRFFVTLSGCFIDKIILIIIGLFTVGWYGVLYYIMGYILGNLLGYLLNIFLLNSNYKKFGVSIQYIENVFIFLSLGHLEKVSYFEWIKSYYDYINEE